MLIIYPNVAHQTICAKNRFIKVSFTLKLLISSYVTTKNKATDSAWNGKVLAINFVANRIVIRYRFLPSIYHSIGIVWIKSLCTPSKFSYKANALCSSIAHMPAIALCHHQSGGCIYMSIELNVWFSSSLRHTLLSLDNNKNIHFRQTNKQQVGKL